MTDPHSLETNIIVAKVYRRLKDAITKTRESDSTADYFLRRAYYELGRADSLIMSLYQANDPRAGRLLGSLYRVKNAINSYSLQNLIR
jgi:hypothetical protein